ncbi:hypothetical protein AAVH_39316, partial [Aphelenchoides avenae]
MKRLIALCLLLPVAVALLHFSRGTQKDLSYNKKWAMSERQYLAYSLLNWLTAVASFVLDVRTVILFRKLSPAMRRKFNEDIKLL